MDSASTSRVHIAASVRWASLQPRTADPAKVGHQDSNSFPSWINYSKWNHKKGWNRLHLEAEYTAHAAHKKSHSFKHGLFCRMNNEEGGFHLL